MSLWEYKVISSGKGGFATPALLEKFLNDLGRDEWEIVEFRAAPDNSLAFSGLARRSTQRDWTLQDAAAAAAKAEAEKLRAEFEAKFKAATTTAPTAEERAPSFIEEKSAPDDGFRKPVDTSRDDDPEADDEKDDWDKLTAAEEDELPTFFEAIKPHLRRNQRGPGQSVGVDYLAKKWDQNEDDLKHALVECGFEMPEDEDSKPVHIEYDGDIYWLNVNRRGELWINTKEKPRPVFKSFKAQRITLEEEPKVESGGGARPDAGFRRPERPERQNQPESTPEGEGQGAGAESSGAQEQSAAPQRQSSDRPPERQQERQSDRQSERQSDRRGGPLPDGPELLDRIRPHMRRNRRGPGGSGSTTFLARALKTNEADLKAAFAALGLTIPAAPNDKPVYTEVNDAMWWLNLDSRGGLWINGREKKPGETAHSAAASDQADAAPENAGGSTSPVPTSGSDVAPATGETQSADSGVSQASAESPAAGGAQNAVLASVRHVLKETRTGSVSATVDRLAEEVGKSTDDFVATLVGAGLKVPEKAREKPVLVEHAGEVFWLNKNAKGEMWLNAKAAKGDSAGDDTSKGDSADESAAETSGESGPASGGAAAEKKTPSRLRRGGRSRKKTE